MKRKRSEKPKLMTIRRFGAKVPDFALQVFILLSRQVNFAQARSTRLLQWLNAANSQA